MTAKGLAQDLVHVDQADGDHVVLVPLDRVENLPTTDELRMTKDQFQQLCTSIKQEGLHQPVTLRPLADKLYRLVAGRHRAAAHVELGLEAVPAIIREDLDDASETVATAVENLHRADLRPYEEAEAYQTILDVEGMTQVKLAKRIGVSQSHISKRLKLLQVPRDIGLVAGDRLKLEDAAWFAPIGEWPTLVPQVATVLEKRLSSERPWFNKAQVVVEGICDGKTCWAPFEQLGDVASIDKAGYSAKWWVKDNATFRKDIYALEHMRFGPEKSPDLVVVVGDDVRKAKEAAERAVQRYQAQQEKEHNEEAVVAAQYRQEAAARKEKKLQRIANKRRTLQIEEMAAHVQKTTFAAEELQKHVYRQFLRSVGQVASRKIDRQALADILGEYAPSAKKNPWGTLDEPLARGLPELVDQLWEKDRVVLDRYVAAVIHLDAGGYDHDVRDDQVLKFTTGRTTKQIQAAAEEAVAGPKKTAKAKKEKAPPRPKVSEATNGQSAGRPSCPLCNKWIKPTAQNKIPRHKDNDTGDWCAASGTEHAAGARPGAAPGKECPECKTVVAKQGRGDDARLVCLCTPAEGVPVEAS